MRSIFLFLQVSLLSLFGGAFVLDLMGLTFQQYGRYLLPAAIIAGIVSSVYVPSKERKARESNGQPPVKIVQAMQDLADPYFKYGQCRFAGIAKYKGKWVIRLEVRDHQLQVERNNTKFRGYPVIVSFEAEDPPPFEVTV